MVLGILLNIRNFTEKEEGKQVTVAYMVEPPRNNQVDTSTSYFSEAIDADQQPGFHYFAPGQLWLLKKHTAIKCEECINTWSTVRLSDACQDWKVHHKSNPLSLLQQAELLSSALSEKCSWTFMIHGLTVR